MSILGLLAAILVLVILAAVFCALCAMRLSSRRNREQSDREQMAFLHDWQENHPHPRR